MHECTECHLDIKTTERSVDTTTKMLSATNGCARVVAGRRHAPMSDGRPTCPQGPRRTAREEV